MSLESGQREAAQRDLCVEAVGAGVGIRDEQDRARRMSLGESGERVGRRLLVRRGHPGQVGQHARAEVGHTVLLDGSAQLTDAALDPADCRVETDPVVERESHAYRRHERPSRASSSSAAAGPGVPAA